MIKPKEIKICKDQDCENEFKPFLSTQKYCSSKCTHKNKKPSKPPAAVKFKQRKAIKPISDKQKKQLAIYHRDRLVFLQKPENKKCPVTGAATTEIHHMKGRKGFADEWAKLKGIKLLHDQRFWLAVSRSGHRKIEENPEWAKDNSYSFNRLEF